MILVLRAALADARNPGGLSGQRQVAGVQTDRGWPVHSTSGADPENRRRTLPSGRAVGRELRQFRN